MEESENNAVHGRLIIEDGRARFHLEEPRTEQYHERRYRISFIPLDTNQVEELFPQIKGESENSPRLPIPYDTFKTLARRYLRKVSDELLKRELDSNIEGMLKEAEED